MAIPIRTTQDYANMWAGKLPIQGLSIQEAFNSKAGRTGTPLTIQDAANFIAGTDGWTTRDALNSIAETHEKSIQECLQVLAGEG